MSRRIVAGSLRQAFGFALVTILLTAPLSALVPPEITSLISSKKYNEASLRIYELMPVTIGPSRLELARLVYDHDPDLVRLKNHLRAWVEEPADTGNRPAMARLLGQLTLVQRDYLTAQWSYEQIANEPDASLLSAGLLLMLGRNSQSKQGLVELLSQTKDSAIIEKASCLLAWLVWSEGQGKVGLEILANKNSAPALYIIAVISRSLGLKTQDQAARDRLNKDWPNSVWAALAEPNSDPALQVDTTLMILTGIGVAAAGDTSRTNLSGGSVGTGKVGTVDDAPAKAIQVGYFRESKYAQSLMKNLNAKGFMAQVEDDKPNKSYKVLVLIRPGQDPEALVLQLKDIGMEGILVF